MIDNLVFKILNPWKEALSMVLNKVYINDAILHILYDFMN